MAHLQLVKQTSSGLLLPATPESGDFLRSVKIGEWIHADFKRVRNYAFHKRFFKLLQLGFDYWTPTGGTVTSREQKLISGFVNFLCDSAGQEYTPALNEAAEQYLHNVANGWQTSTELVEDTVAISHYGRNLVKMDAFGCTSRGQAHRAGLWLIKTELLETQTVDFSVGAEGLRHVPGDVIEVCDEDYAGISLGGRILSVDRDRRILTLDRDITLTGW